MIWESYPWKQQLLRDSGLLKRLAGQDRETGTHKDFVFEQKIFLSAYAIRKLFDANKLTDDLRDWGIQCEQFARTSKEFTPSNWHRIEELYDLMQPCPVTWNARRLLDQIIHSYVFMLSGDQSGKVTGFIITSDRDKEKHLLLVPLANFCEYMREVGRNHPTHVHTWFDDTTGKWLNTIR